MPLPNSEVIPGGWSEHHRPVAEGGMTATGELRRPGGQTGFDEAAGRSTYGEPPAYHSGPCRVQAVARNSAAPEVGDRQVTVRPYRVSWPVGTPEVRVNDQVKLPECEDAQLIGHVMRVVEVLGGSLVWQRDLICEDITPTTR